MSDARQLAENLRQVRERRGMTPEQLDDLAGLDRGSVEAFELTQRVASAAAVHDLASALGVPVSALLPELGSG